MDRVQENNETCVRRLTALFHAADGNITRMLLNKGNRCIDHFDGSSCWPMSEPGVVVQECPFVFCDKCDVPQSARLVTRECQTNGSWHRDVDYSNCLLIMRSHAHCYESLCNKCVPDQRKLTVIYVSLTFSFASLVLLCLSILIFNMFKSIQCRRLSIHKHMAGAFVLRVSAFILWTLLQQNFYFFDCIRQRPSKAVEWQCKLLLFFVMYSQCASIAWMSVEGAYLISRFTVLAMRSNEGPWILYVILGWGWLRSAVHGLPLLPTAAWTVFHSNLESTGFCWVPYTTSPYLWILTTAIGSMLALNLSFLMLIVMILFRKLKAENAAESRKIWRTMKATLLLVPMLGISNIPLFYEPPKPPYWYHLGSAVLQYSQVGHMGIFIALLYCFFNGEVQSAIRRSLLTSGITQSLADVRRKSAAGGRLGLARKSLQPNGHSEPPPAVVAAAAAARSPRAKTPSPTRLPLRPNDESNELSNLVPAQPADGAAAAATLSPRHVDSPDEPSVTMRFVM